MENKKKLTKDNHTNNDIKLLKEASSSIEKENPSIQEEFLTAKELSKLLKIPVSTIYQETRTGRIRAFRFGRHYRYLLSHLELCKPNKKW